jgi:hypothetical protein
MTSSPTPTGGSTRGDGSGFFPGDGGAGGAKSEASSPDPKTALNSDGGNIKGYPDEARTGPSATFFMAETFIELTFGGVENENRLVP